MTNEQIIDILKKNNDYLIRRKDIVFQGIETIRQTLEMIQMQIQEKSDFINRQKQKETEKRNIFRLYDTTSEIMRKIKQAEEQLNLLKENNKKNTDNLESLEKELEEINEQIIYNKILQRNISNDENLTEEKKENGNDNCIEEISVIPKKEKEYSDIVRRLEFCKELLEVDKTRCFLELGILIDELSE